MRIDNLIGVFLLASFTVSAVANAAEPAARGEGRLRKPAAVESTGLPWNVPEIRRLSPVLPERYPSPDWTALIGTGAASTVERGIQRSGANSSARLRHYPDLHWTSAIGTGGAAALERDHLRVDHPSTRQVMRQ
jgi:hypothetical protein